MKLRQAEFVERDRVWQFPFVTELVAGVAVAADLYKLGSMKVHDYCDNDIDSQGNGKMSELSVIIRNGVRLVTSVFNVL